MGRFDDQVAIVAGAGSGTGAAIATQLAKEGTSVACTDLDGAEETAARLGERGRAVRLDVADAGSVARLIAEVRETYGRLDALFNSAGVDGMVRPLTDLSEENFELVMRVNLKGPFLTMKHAIPLMVEGGGGADVSGQANHEADPQALVQEPLPESRLLHLGRCSPTQGRTRGSCDCRSSSSSVNGCGAPSARVGRLQLDFERLAVAQARGRWGGRQLVSYRPGCQQSPDHVIRRGEPL